MLGSGWAVFRIDIGGFASLALSTSLLYRGESAGAEFRRDRF
jgi:hypothetical protein